MVGLDPPSVVNKTPPSDDQLKTINESPIIEVDLKGTELDSISKLLETADPNNDATIDSLFAQLGEQDVTPWKRHVAKQAIKTLQADNEDALNQEVYANLSVAMLLLLPVFAVFLWLFNRKQSPFYMDSLVFSIHFHSVALFVFSLNVLAALFFDDATMFKIALASILLYLVFAIRRVYQFTWMKSIGKALGLSLSYSIVFGISYLLVVALSFWKY